VLITGPSPSTASHGTSNWRLHIVQVTSKRLLKSCTQVRITMDQIRTESIGSRATLLKFFDSNPTVSFVRFCLMTHASIVRVSVMPKESALDVADGGFFASPGSPFAAGSTAMDTLIWDHLKTGVDNIIPDWDSLRLCTFYPAHAMVMCAINESLELKIEESNNGSEASTATDDGFDLCPRTILSKQVVRAAKAGQDLLVGLELEFLIYENGTDFTRPRGHSSFFNTTSLHGKYAPAMDEIVLNIGNAGIKVLKYHPESGREGLFEIVLAPYPPMQAADAMVFCREAIKTVAKKHGLEATLMPTPFENGAELGVHTNLSISDPSNGSAQHFLAGILDSLVAICAFAMPSIESGPRAHRWQGWVKWGKGNKACVVQERREGFWEIRCSDGTMNPYLTFAAMIASGITGLETRKELTLKPMNGLSMAMKTLTDDERENFGIKHKISDSLGVLIEALKDDKVLRSAEYGFGERFVKFYSAIKKKEIEDSISIGVLERKEMLRHLF
jgi:glutamine synthetase